MGSIAFGSMSLRRWTLGEGEARAHHASGAELYSHLHLVRAGSIVLPDCQLEVGEGEGVLIDGTGVHHTRALSDMRAVTVRFPASVLHGVTSHDAGPLMLTDAATRLFAPFSDFCARAVETPADETSTLAAYYFERLLQEMTIGVVVDTLRAGMARGTAVRRAPEQFTLAVAIITAQLTDADLTPASVARELNTSLRQVQRQFSKHGTTVEREIRRARVEHALALLRDGSFDALTIDQVARYSGFADGSSLARAMAAEGHMSPSRVRRTAAETAVAHA